LILAAMLPSQQRTDFIFHVYVDPIYGDDAAATNQNPGGAGTVAVPLGQHPDVDPGPPLVRPLQGRLFQAPFAFRTVTAAVAYVAATFGNLPWSSPENFTVEKVVVHCLPGIYGPALGTPLDAATGLPWNGEAFPIVLPHGVSIRGTSALDVVFDARAQNTTIFDVPTAVSVPPRHHTQDFINGVTIRNARSTVASPFGIGAGVYIHGDEQNQRTVSNCFVVGNTVGIAIASDLGNQPPPSYRVHQVNIINNTVAWNAIGIWNGDQTLADPPAENELRVFNNIIDASPPNTSQYPVPVSSFEGLSTPQMTVVQLLDPNNVQPPINILSNVNAWPLGFHDLGIGTQNWPAVSVFAGATPTSARFDLSPYIGQGFFPRPAAAVLYVNDALRVTTSTDYSRNDFRLAPVAANGLGQTTLNPLVNLGIALPPSTTAWQRMVTGRGPAIALPPGPSSIGNVIDPPATVHCWDWDAEGFGNVRIANRTGFGGGFLQAAIPGVAEIDLGADEMGQLIMAGFIEGTRIFSHNVPAAPGILDHTRVYFLDLPGGPYSRPDANLLIGGIEPGTIYYQWWTHVQTPVNAALSANFTRGNASPQSARFFLTTPPPPPPLPSQNRPVFMRELICDYSPHLIRDIHPLWQYYWDSIFFQQPVVPGPMRHDVYGSHPWCAAPWDPGTGAMGIHWSTWDNPYLYYNPNLPGYQASNLIWGYIQYHNVTVGVTSPPGSYYYSTDSPPYHTAPPGYFLTSLATGTFGPFGSCSPGVAGTYATNPLGIGDIGTGCPDEMPIFPGLDGLGVRFNCQRYPNGVPIGNLQTFLVVTTFSENPVDLAARQPGWSRERGNTQDALERSSLRRAAEFMRTGR